MARQVPGSVAALVAAYGQDGERVASGGGELHDVAAGGEVDPSAEALAGQAGTALLPSSTTNEPAGVAAIFPDWPESVASSAGAVQPPPREWRDVSGTQVMVDPISTFLVSRATASRVPSVARPEATVEVLLARMTGAVQVPSGLRVAACLHAGKIRLSRERSSRGLVRCLRMLVSVRVPAAQAICPVSCGATKE